jgi:CHASE2 domain-containing sensor protein
MIRKKLCDIKNIKIKLHSSILDYMGICLIVFLLGYILVFASLNLSIFNPLKQALEDFKMTDLYFELMRSDKEKELNKDIVLVDVTKLTSRDSIAQVITDIHSCSPKVLMIDLIFERRSFDNTEDIRLMNAIEMGKDKEILSAKLTGYKPEKEAFTNLTKSFFYEIADFKWGYSNVSQTRPGGSIRKYSLSQRLNDSISYSMAYLAACAYMGIKPESKDASERLIVYDDTDFLAIESDKVLENASLLKDKIVILGTLEEEADMHITPVGKLSGMKILAYSTMTFMNHKKIQHMGKFASLLMAFVVCMFCAWAGRHIRRKYTNVTSYILKLFYFVVTAFLVWIAFILFVHFDYDANLLYSLLGLALVEEGRLQYSSIVKTLGKHTKWNFIKKSIYYDK